MAKRFFYVCAGLLCLALAYHLGARSATAQAPGNPVVSSSGMGYGSYNNWAVTANGDVYGSNDLTTWARTGNMFGAPTPATQETWGGVKTRYRQDGTAKQAQDR